MAHDKKGTKKEAVIYAGFLENKVDDCLFSSSSSFSLNFSFRLLFSLRLRPRIKRSIHLAKRLRLRIKLMLGLRLKALTVFKHIQVQKDKMTLDKKQKKRQPSMLVSLRNHHR
jgi:hypothetical protein